jgi:predicted permease
MWKDFIFALRTLRKSPAFTTAAIASLALGIGANAAIFSFVNAILLKQLPVPEPKRLVTFSQTFRGEPTGKVWDITTIAELAKRDSAFSGVFGRFGWTISFSTGDTAQWVLGELVTGQYFRTLRAKPVAGRLLTEDDVRDAAANPVCVLSYEIWQRELAGDRAAVGRTVFLNGHPYRVLGVTAKGFMGADMQHRIDLRIPATRIGDFMPAFGNATGLDWLNISWLSPMARLKPGVSTMEAQLRTRQLLDQIEKSGKSEETLQLEDGSQGFDTMRSAFGRPVLVLMAVAAVVLLVACANLANLLLARAQARAKEFAVRMSIGASRSILIRQLLIESLLLAAGGGVSGLLLSFWITQTLLAFLNEGRSAAAALVVTPDLTVLAFSIALSFATAIVFGLVPAWQATRH